MAICPESRLDLDIEVRVFVHVYGAATDGHSHLHVIDTCQLVRRLPPSIQLFRTPTPFTSALPPYMYVRSIRTLSYTSI